MFFSEFHKAIDSLINQSLILASISHSAQKPNKEPSTKSGSFNLRQHKLLSAFLTADGGLFERGLGHADNERTFADGFPAAGAGFVVGGFFFASFGC